MNNDIQLLDALRGKNRVVQGAGFKQADNGTARIINERLLARWDQSGSALFCPSLDDRNMFWLTTKKTADWQLLDNQK